AKAPPCSSATSSLTSTGSFSTWPPSQPGRRRDGAGAGVRSGRGRPGLSFGPLPRVPSGAHTYGQAEWLPALEQAAARLCQARNDVAALPELQVRAIADRYTALLGQFQNPAFLTSGEYLIDMGGKELLAALSHYLYPLGARLNRDGLADEL